MSIHRLRVLLHAYLLTRRANFLLRQNQRALVRRKQLETAGRDTARLNAALGRRNEQVMALDGTVRELLASIGEQQTAAFRLRFSL